MVQSVSGGCKLDQKFAVQSNMPQAAPTSNTGRTRRWTSGCDSHPCLNGADCDPVTLQGGAYWCRCPQGFVGNQCEHRVGTRLLKFFSHRAAFFSHAGQFFWPSNSCRKFPFSGDICPDVKND